MTVHNDFFCFAGLGERWASIVMAKFQDWRVPPKGFMLPLQDHSVSTVQHIVETV